MKAKATGPALGGAQERWGDDEMLYAWIRNSQALVKAGYPRAVELMNEYKSVMTAYPTLTDDEIGSILAYINGTYDGTYGVAAVAGGGGDAVAVVKKSTPKYLYWMLLGVLMVLALILSRIITNLNRLAAAKAGDDTYESKSLMQTLTSKSLIGFAIFGLVIFAGYKTVNNATNLGRQQAYAPELPIKFSHETHAGLHKIDCQYCHDGARRSKHSVIPAANTCMNCHRAIVKGSTYGTAELTKIFASVGYDPVSNTYVEGYADMSNDEIMPIYTKWIEQNYLEDNELTALDDKGKKEVKNQWEAIVESLTNDQKDKVYGPIEWVRIHNLPDHVYFNHAQHVSVGEVECQTCHGTVEEMEVAAQVAPLSMGWCINCHRQTEVKFAANDYYDSYEKYHEQLNTGDMEKVTVADIGGLECQKCHY